MVSAELLAQSIPASTDPVAGPSGVAIHLSASRKFPLTAPIAINPTVGKADTEGSFSLLAQFRFCRSRHLESAVCNPDIVPLSESKRDPAEIGFAPVRRRRRSKAVHRFCGDRAAITCRFQPSWRTPEPRARPPFLLAALPRFSPSCAPDETTCPM